MRRFDDILSYFKELLDLNRYDRYHLSINLLRLPFRGRADRQIVKLLLHLVCFSFLWLTNKLLSQCCDEGRVNTDVTLSRPVLLIYTLHTGALANERISCQFALVLSWLPSLSIFAFSFSWFFLFGR